MSKSIQHSLFFSHPPELVWEFLTTSELIAQWLMPNDFQPILGHEFQFRIKPIPQFDFDGIVYCRVLEIVPHKKLSYSWKGGPGEGKITMDSIVTWTLTPKDNGTMLLLQHNDFRILENMAMFSSMDQGWLQNMNKIPVLINAAAHGTTNR